MPSAPKPSVAEPSEAELSAAKPAVAKLAKPSAPHANSSVTSPTKKSTSIAQTMLGSVRDGDAAPTVLLVITASICLLGLGATFWGMFPLSKKSETPPGAVVVPPSRPASRKQVPLPAMGCETPTLGPMAPARRMSAQGEAAVRHSCPGTARSYHMPLDPSPPQSMVSLAQPPASLGLQPTIGYGTPSLGGGGNTPRTSPSLGGGNTPRTARTPQGSARAEAGTFLCPGLVVPAECECLLVVPVLDPEHTSCEVTDSHRVPVFRVAYRYASSKTPKATKCLVLKSYSDDNARFATCSRGPNGSLTILDASDVPFGLIRGCKGGFEVETRLGMQVRVGFTDRTNVEIVDRRGRTIALTESDPGNSQKRMVRIGPFVDAGLVTLAVLASDLLDETVAS